MSSGLFDLMRLNWPGRADEFWPLASWSQIRPGLEPDAHFTGGAGWPAGALYATWGGAACQLGLWAGCGGAAGVKSSSTPESRSVPTLAADMAGIPEFWTGAE